jgi:HD superfamily phosphohydrolase
MPRKKKTEPTADLASPLFPAKAIPLAPDFLHLLRQPLLKEEKLPADFNEGIEASHLVRLWETVISLHKYRFEGFVHAGGSGMVFKVFREDSATPLALKIARKKLMVSTAPTDAANALSPVSEAELRALERLAHPHVVRLYDAIEEPGTARVLAIATTFVESPMPIDKFLRETLAKNPDPRGVKGLHPFSPQRLEIACRFLLAKCQEIASALEHMHSIGIYHFDVKPANILISSAQPQPAVLTDMGACIHLDKMSAKQKVRVHFTWTYAHPDLTNMLHDPGSISGGGLRARTEVDVGQEFAKYDLYAFGRTIQEALTELVDEFGERAYASYAFRYLHIIACLLLDGKNAPAPTGETAGGVTKQHGRRFVEDVALNYQTELFALHRIKTAAELVHRLSRFSREYSFGGLTPELDPALPDVVNSGIGPAPFTRRVAAIFTHPALRRLKSESHLGWMKEIYPGATHNRWSHSLGVFAATADLFNSLLSDPEVPTFRILCDPTDIWHALVAAMIHDVGQSAFGHDFEEVSPLFSHDSLVRRLLFDTHWGEALHTTIEKNWKTNHNRILAILEKKYDRANERRALDGVASDCINGVVDADKLDYLVRDSIGCGVPYGRGMDLARLRSALSVASLVEAGAGVRLGLAYKAKGRPAIESMLIARYQMYGAVYWHHTFRCVQAMFSYAANLTFGSLSGSPTKMRGALLKAENIQELFYQKVILGKSWAEVREGFNRKEKRVILSEEFGVEFSAPVSSERAIEFVYRFAEDSTRKLLDRLLARGFYKRAFELRIGEFAGDYFAVKAEFTPEKKLSNARAIQKRLLDAVDHAMRERGERDTVAKNAARERLASLRSEDLPLVVIDFPVRAIPPTDLNLPREIGDSYRKYFALPAQKRPESDNVFAVVRRLQMQIAAIRVFVAPEFHELVIRYLRPNDVAGCVTEVLPIAKMQ